MPVAMEALLVVAVLIAAKTIVEEWLDARNRKSVRRHADAVPEAYKGIFDDETYKKSVNYTLDRSRFGTKANLFDAAVLFIVLGSGLLPLLYGLLTGWFGSDIWGQATALFLIGVLLSIPGLPWEYYAQFVIEERYGFNKSSVGLWVTDKVKGLVIGMLLTVPLLALLFAFYQWLPNTWWLWGYAAFFVFQLMMLVIYPMFIMPLFNKFEPLPEGELRERLFKLAERTKFPAKEIFVMDGSRRSAHSNAFFTGFGGFRRIVLYDTLVEQLDPAELEGVLAHEIGHFKLGHIPRRVAVSAVMGLVAFALLGWLAASGWFTAAFGFENVEAVAPAFLLFSLLSGLASFWFAPLSNAWSRAHEYQADRFARNAQGEYEPLLRALRKLHEKNLSNLTPDPLFSRFHYSHPTLHERERALKEQS